MIFDITPSDLMAQLQNGSDLLFPASGAAECLEFQYYHNCGVTRKDGVWNIKARLVPETENFLRTFAESHSMNTSENWHRFNLRLEGSTGRYYSCGLKVDAETHETLASFQCCRCTSLSFDIRRCYDEYNGCTETYCRSCMRPCCECGSTDVVEASRMHRLFWCREHVPVNGFCGECGRQLDERSRCPRCDRPRVRCYSYKPRLKLFKSKSKCSAPLGVEVETCEEDRYRAEELIIDSEFWYAKEDCSITGLEMVSKPVDREYQTKAVGELFMDGSWYFSDRNGMHVHIGREYVSRTCAVHLSRLLFGNRRFAERLGGREINEYCSVGNSSQIKTTLSRGRFWAGGRDWLNLTPETTIEFRGFRQPLSEEEALNNMDLVRWLVEWGSVTSLQATSTASKALDSFKCYLPDKLLSYYYNRSLIVPEHMLSEYQRDDYWEE